MRVSGRDYRLDGEDDQGLAVTIDPESLEHLLLSPGWAAFVAHVEQEWGPTGVRYQQALETALNLTDSEAAASQARQVLAARKTVELLLKAAEGNQPSLLA